MEWLIAGLGNPGEQYRRTRHNAGFMVADELARRLETTYGMQGRFKAEIAETSRFGGVGIIKPQTFMNLSGAAVGNIARYYKIPAEKVIVIHDDLDLEMGTVKAGRGKGPKQHNGILSVEEGLGTADFWRVRVGIEDRTGDERKVIPGQAYVLMTLSETEETALRQGLELAVIKVVNILGGKI